MDVFTKSLETLNVSNIVCLVREQFPVHLGVWPQYSNFALFIIRLFVCLGGFFLQSIDVLYCVTLNIFMCVKLVVAMNK